MDGQLTERQQNDLLKLEKAAADKVFSSPTKFLMFGIGSFLLLSSVGIEVAAVVSLGFIYSAIKRAINNGANAAYMRETGNFAHLLNDRELIKLTKLVGKETVIEQLKEAYEDGKPLSDASYDYLEHAQVELDEPDLELFLNPEAKERREQEKAEVLEGVVSKVKRLVGSQTRLEAIDVPATVFTEPDNDDPDLFYDLPEGLGLNPQTALIIGVPGAGKGMVVSNAIRHLKKAHPDITIVGVDPKDDPKETGYWSEGFDIVYRKELKEMRADAAVLWVESCIGSFRNIEGPKLLVLDEATLVLSKFKLSTDKKALSRMVDFIVGMVSSGDSRREFIWVVGQTAGCAELGFSGGVRSLFRGVAIASAKNEGASNALMDTKFVPLPPDGRNGVKRLMNESPVQRAFYDSRTNRWYAMPELHNYSGYDRDSGKHIRPVDTCEDTEAEAEDSSVDTAKTAEDTVEAAVEVSPEAALRFELIKRALSKSGGPDAQAMLGLIEYLQANTGQELSIRQLQGSYWAKKHKCRSKEQVEQLLLEAKNQNLIAWASADEGLFRVVS